MSTDAPESMFVYQYPVIAYGFKRCDGWPHCGCPNEATNDILGYKLCADCARAYVAPDQLSSYALVTIPGVELGACPFCEDTHAPSKCPIAAAMTGQPLIAGLRAENARLMAELDQAHQHIGALISNTPPRSGTNLEDAITAALTWLRRRTQPNEMVFLRAVAGGAVR